MATTRLLERRSDAEDEQIKTSKNDGDSGTFRGALVLRRRSENSELSRVQKPEFEIVPIRYIVIINCAEFRQDQSNFFALNRTLFRLLLPAKNAICYGRLRASPSRRFVLLAGCVSASAVTSA